MNAPRRPIPTRVMVFVDAQKPVQVQRHWPRGTRGLSGRAGHEDLRTPLFDQLSASRILSSKVLRPPTISSQSGASPKNICRMLL